MSRVVDFVFHLEDLCRGIRVPTLSSEILMILEAFTAFLYIFYDPASKQYALTTRVISLEAYCRA